MEKSKLGISIGLLGAITCITALCGGFTPTFLLVGFILLTEKNEWLKKLSVKVAVIMVVFAALNSVIYLLPDAIGAINNLTMVFGQSFSISFVSNLVYFCTDVVDILEKVVLLILALKALSMGDVVVGPIDNIINKHFSNQKVEVAKVAENTPEKKTAKLEK